MANSFYFLLLELVCLSSFYDNGNAAAEKKCTFDLDSLKLKMYSLAYESKLRKFVNRETHLESEDDSIFNVIECEIQIRDTVDLGDTVQYFLDFKRYNGADEYLTLKPNDFVGIGYVKSQCIYYPLLGQSAFDVELSYYKDFFETKQGEFTQYLKKYNGNTCHWIKQFMRAQLLL